MNISDMCRHKSRFILGLSASFSDNARHVGLILPVASETQTSSYGLTAKFVKRSRNKVGTQKVLHDYSCFRFSSISAFAYGVIGRFHQLSQLRD